MLAGVLVLVAAAIAVLNWGPELEPAAEPVDDGASVACGSTPVAAQARPTYTAPPDDLLVDRIDYWAIIHTSCGDVVVDLLEDRAPTAVNNFVFLAQNDFFAGLTWPHVVHNGVILTGDPNDDPEVPPNDAGYRLPDLPRKEMFRYGDVVLNNTGAEDSAGSQFLIVTQGYEQVAAGTPVPVSLGRMFTRFGRVAPESLSIVETIARQEVIATAGSHAYRPISPVFVEDVEIFRK